MLNDVFVRNNGWPGSRVAADPGYIRLPNEPELPAPMVFGGDGKNRQRK
jgi:hypothetical protein